MSPTNRPVMYKPNLIKRIHFHAIWQLARFFRLLSKTPEKLLSRWTVLHIGSRIIKSKKTSRSSTRKKPHILILRHRTQWNQKDSEEQYWFDESLNSTGLATFDVLTYDHDLCFNPICDLQLIRKACEIKPDIILVSSWVVRPRYPSVHSFNLIRSMLGIPIVVIWTDTCSKNFWNQLSPYMSVFDVHVCVDNPALKFANKESPLFSRILFICLPPSPKLYRPREIRDIPVIFCGQVSSYRSYRRETIEYLIKQGVPGVFSTVDRNELMCREKYAELLGRSKIGINFSYSVDCDQLKGRVLETIFSGAMVLESENNQTSCLLTPMRDYVPFRNKEDLVEKIHYYLKNEHELKAIADHGYKTALANYGPDVFWKTLFGKLNLGQSS